MGRIIGVLLAVGAIWVAAEVYTEGPDAAFGGRLAGLTRDREAPAEERLSAPRRAGAAVERAHRDQEERYDDLLGK